MKKKVPSHPRIFLKSTIFSLIAFISFLFLIKDQVQVQAGMGDVQRYDYEQSLSISADSVSKKKAKAEKARVDGQTKGEASQEDYVYGSGDILSSWFLTGVWGPETDGLDLEGAREAEQILGQGVVPSLSSYIAYMYQKPASTQTYLADVFQSAKIIPQAQAQGLGFASLNPVLSTWKAFRNLAYLFFVVIFLVIGFMIMFRQKIGGQTIITVQQAIPNIIVALLFVTFSYAIGGLLIDFMYVVMYLITGIFKGSASLMNKNFLEVGWELVKAGFAEGSDVGKDTIELIIDAGGVDEVLGWISGLTVGVIVSLAVLFGVFKLFFEVLKSYVSIILLIVFSPLILMIGAIPGQNSFASWIKNLVGNLSIFPVILLMLIIKNQISTMGGESGGFMPPYLISQGFGAGLSAIVGIGVLLAIPEIAKKIKETLGAKEGVLGELAGTAWGRAKTATPAGLRLSALGLGTVGAAGAGTLGAGLALLRGENPLHAGRVSAKETGDLLLGGKNVNANLPIIGQKTISFPGLVRAAGATSRAIGANQPDIMNLITQPIDEKWDPEGAKKEKVKQFWEDTYQAAVDTGVSAQDRLKGKKRR